VNNQPGSRVLSTRMRWLATAVMVLGVGCRDPRPPLPPAPITTDGALPAAAAATLDAGVPDADAAGSADALATAVPCEPDDAPDAEGAAAQKDTLTLTKVAFTDLPGWADDHHAEAVPSLLNSCAKLAQLAASAPVGHDGHGGTAKQWRHLCAAAAKVTPGDDVAAKAMFEAETVPYQAAGTAGAEGKLTGYYVQELHGSRTKTGAFKYPVYKRPTDLVMVDLSTYIKDSHGRRIWGRFDAKGDMVPYYTRAEIRKGALDGKGLEILYVDDAVDLLFAHIEGSAKVRMDDGTEVWLEFAGKNGRAYRGVGGVLKSMGELQAKGSGTMPGIKAWFTAHPDKFDEVVDQTHSFVFFAESATAGAIGSQMVVLTPRRSMAVDRAFIAHGTPIWVDTRIPVVGGKGAVPWHQLLVAQDTGGGILGAVRGDIYWGADAAAQELGGRMGGPGKYWLLLPKGVTK
jgi:membrane-bound lytic murein transglycosylase A